MGIADLASLEDLIQHGLIALRETLQQDKDLTIKNTTIGIIGPAGETEKNVLPGGPFRMLEEESVQPYLRKLPAKTVGGATAAAAAEAPLPGDEDVQMAE